MKKFLAGVIGGFLILVLVTGMVSCSVEASDKHTVEAREFVMEAFSDMAAPWNVDAAVKHCADEFWEATSGGLLEAVFGSLNQQLGSMTSFDEINGNVKRTFNLRRGIWLEGVYSIKASFQYGTANLCVTVVKDDGKWQVWEFEVTPA